MAAASLGGYCWWLLLVATVSLLKAVGPDPTTSTEPLRDRPGAA